MLGYFPTYALGSAYGAQFLDSMQKDIDVFGSVAKGDLSPVIGWLTDKIYKHGSMIDPKPLFEAAVGKPFDPSYFTEYLEKKYGELYGV